MRDQIPLFDPPEDTMVPSPLCLKAKHCGAMAALGPRVTSMTGASQNRSIRCLKCGATGEQSTRTVGKGAV